MGIPRSGARQFGSLLALLGLLPWSMPVVAADMASPTAGLVLELVDGEGSAIEGAVASLHDPDGAPLLPPGRPVDEAVIEQTRGEFDPALTLIDIGTPVRFPNLDRIRHHVYSFSPAKTFELPLYSGEPHDPVVFDTAGLVTLGCNIHDWMLAHVLVMDTPWRAISNEKGHIQLVPPPGDYLMRIWHPGLPAGQGSVEHRLAVDGSLQVLTVELDLSRPPLRRTRDDGARPRSGTAALPQSRRAATDVYE